MQIYTSLPSVNKTWIDSTLATIPTSGALKARIELTKLFVLTIGEAWLHAFAATTKLVFTAVQLPSYYLLGGTHPLIPLAETGAHALRAVKLATAATFVTIPALALPILAPTCYERLGLHRRVPSSLPPTKTERIYQTFKTALASRYGQVALVGATLLTAYVVTARVAFGTSANSPEEVLKGNEKSPEVSVTEDPLTPSNSNTPMPSGSALGNVNEARLENPASDVHLDENPAPAFSPQLMAVAALISTACGVLFLKKRSIWNFIGKIPINVTLATVNRFQYGFLNQISIGEVLRVLPRDLPKIYKDATNFVKGTRIFRSIAYPVNLIGKASSLLFKKVVLQPITSLTSYTRFFLMSMDGFKDFAMARMDGMFEPLDNVLAKGVRKLRIFLAGTSKSGRPSSTGDDV